MECFYEICEANDIYSSVVLVATGERLVEASEIGAWKDAVHRGARIFLYLNIKESAERAIMLITHSCTSDG